MTIKPMTSGRDSFLMDWSLLASVFARRGWGRESKKKRAVGAGSTDDDVAAGRWSAKMAVSVAGTQQPDML